MIRSALFALLGLAGSAAAETLPGSYDVSGVAANDVLNIRAEPNARAPIVGTLPANAHMIEVVGRQGNWGLVNTGEGAGWAYLKYLTRRPGDDWFRVTGTLRCFGTEPFWSLTLMPAQNTLRREEPGQPEHRLPLGTRQGEAGRATVSFGDAVSGGDLMMEARACSDGMSDRRFGIAVIGRLRPGLAGNSAESALNGCCSLQP